jgi:hypothetical protein
LKLNSGAMIPCMTRVVSIGVAKLSVKIICASAIIGIRKNK